MTAILPLTGNAQTITTGQISNTIGGEPVDAKDIVVTGSRIRGVAPVGSTVVAIDREEMAATGQTTTADILRQIPQVTSIGFNAEGSTGAANSSNITRASAPNLRGLGPTATLTIIDGKRVPAAGTQGQLVDPSIIPPIALERAEVIADGASAIYGSDAVAGVINLIPIKRFSGVEVTGRAALGKNYGDQQVGAIVGTNWTGGHIVAAVDYVHNSGVDAADRDFITDDRRSFGGQNGLSTNCAAPGTMTVGSSAATGTTYALRGGSGVGVLRAGLTAGTSNTCDSSRLINRLLPESQRVSLYAYADQELTENVKIWVQGLYSRRSFEAVRSPATLTNQLIPVTNPFRPADVAISGPGSNVYVTYSLVPEVGRINASGWARTWQGLSGIEANVGAIRLRASGSYGVGEDAERRKLVNTYQLGLALADSNPLTALNLFGSGGNNNPATLDKVFSGLSVIHGRSTMGTAEMSADGPLFALPAGDVRFAAGGEYRRETLLGDGQSTSRTTGVQQASPSSFYRRTVKAAYGEVFLPLFSPANAVPGIQRLELSAALRHEQYSDAGKTTNPKIGINWQPIEGLLLRGSYGKSFRAPGLAESDPTSSGAAVTFTQNVTFTGVTGSKNQALIRGGNPSLTPETASTWTAGLDLTAVRGLRLGFTYFDITYQNQIVDGFGRTALYRANPTLYSNVVAFQGDANFNRIKAIIQGSSLQPANPVDYNDPNLVLVDARRINVGKVQTNGIDVDLRYSLRTDNAGTFSLTANATRFFTYKSSELGQPTLRVLNTIGFPNRFGARGTLGWAKGQFRSQVTVNYTNAYLNTSSTLVPNVKAYTTIDLDVGYTFAEDASGRNLRLGFNVRNLLDQDPPQVDRDGAYDPSKASAIGRVAAITATTKF
ncbi:TonB-dependent receptor domain-containing protein [Novosphingobium sp. PP1Y]|uniref:TonB-dependent receptor domain-containing protein n=1 Tax=Novosphingobium sp. PP1Y TaxID=702113 RepID=UPI0002D472CE|nr:TonB-dependent receptor [Novosphingobium sp. PP1Y]